MTRLQRPRARPESSRPARGVFRTRRCAALLLILATLAGLAGPAGAEDLSFAVEGVAGPMAENVRAHVGSAWVSGSALLSERRRERLLEQARVQAEEALRPFGHYAPVVAARIERDGEDAWRVSLSIDPGPPVLVEDADVRLDGPGAAESILLDWRAEWPLTAGKVLDQRAWTAQKEAVLDLARSEGYLQAAIVDSAILLDLERNRASLRLQVDTGRQAVMGEVDWDQGLVKDVVLQPMPRFRPGEAYSAWAVDTLRTDLWKTGYFGEVDLREVRDLEADPPRVDFRVQVEPRPRDTHQGTVGYGTDSEFRTQYSWTRNLLSPRGDSVIAAIGWQQRNREIRASMDYRLPRRTPDARRLWSASATFNRERRELLVDSGDGSGEEQGLTSGDVNDFRLRLAHVRLRGFGRSQELLFESLFVDVLAESDEFSDPDFQARNAVLVDARDQAPPRLSRDIETAAVGVEYDFPVIRGKGFATVGHHERAWALWSSDAWGSDVDFTQVYLSSRWNVPLGSRWMLLLRGEAGYTDAEVDRFEVPVDGELATLELTRLPNFYRFQAGGSQSVRGYDFQTLTDNGFGSNHILTASVEVEWNVRGNWAGALFFDTGNAFNDWSDPDLKRGWGVGVRWYTIAGPIRFDLAQGLDLEGEPWMVHITLGTPLL